MPDLQAAAAVPVFQVLDAGTGQPLAGVIVQPYRFDRPEGPGGRGITMLVRVGSAARTDAQGRVSWALQAWSKVLFRKEGYIERHVPIGGHAEGAEGSAAGVVEVVLEREPDLRLSPVTRGGDEKGRGEAA